MIVTQTRQDFDSLRPGLEIDMQDLARARNQLEISLSDCYTDTTRLNLLRNRHSFQHIESFFSDGYTDTTRLRPGLEIGTHHYNIWDPPSVMVTQTRQDFNSLRHAGSEQG